MGDAHDVREDVFQLGQSRQHLQHLGVHDLANLRPIDLMNTEEAWRLQRYAEAWAMEKLRSSRACEWSDLLCHLGDDPSSWKTWSALGGACPTLRRSGGMIAAPAAGRQVLLRELYAGMGFPAFQVLADAAQVPVYQVFKPLQGLKYSHMRAALGNSQVVPQVGVFSACVLASLCSR